MVGRLLEAGLEIISVALLNRDHENPIQSGDTQNTKGGKDSKGIVKSR